MAAHLARAGQMRTGAAGITGLSAGGCTTLQALTRHPRAFTAGLCAGGVSAVERLGATTHKLESYYMPALVLPGRGAGVSADVQLVVEGEEHRLSKPASARRWLDAEEKLWRRTLLEEAWGGCH